MKRKLITEPDLYVVNKKPTKKEEKEFSEFLKEYKRKQAAKKKQRKAA